MKRVLAIEEINPGDILWARARGYWRRVDVLATGRTRATVKYVINGKDGRSATEKVQDLPAGRFRRERPVGYYGIVDTPPPSAFSSGDGGGAR